MFFGQTLTSHEYRDKLYGCWLGKTIGGSLGQPFERPVAGRTEPGDISWYVQPNLQPGGNPNDDLDMQLVWLHALESRGVGIGSHELAEEWLDHVGMDVGEYAIAKGNLRKGLWPPVSGSYNNWFKHSMGCPIRSEIWACIAPGRPDVAVRYAQADGCVDHGDGESVFGEMFNAAVESAAFVLSDRERLLDLGLAVIPPGCLTAQAIMDVRAGYREGLEWRRLRERLIDRYGSFNAQYSPINEAFIVLGWLYGKDYGDALCTAVNCGYDTDCTGATLGALLGILLGRGGVPARWAEPIGDRIVTTATWGGIRNFPVPQSLGELTERVSRVAVKVLAVTEDAEGLQRMGTLPIPDGVELETMWGRSGNVVEHDLGCFKFSVDYGEGPAIMIGVPHVIRCALDSQSSMTLRGRLSLEVPPGWSVRPQEGVAVEVQPGQRATVEYTVEVPGGTRLAVSNRTYCRIELDQRPAPVAVPVVFVGGGKWLLAGPFPNESGDGFDHVYGPEEDSRREAVWMVQGREIRWVERSFPDQFLHFDELLRPGGRGVVYALTYLWVPSARRLRVTAPSTDGIKGWLNGRPVLSDHTHGPIKPFPTPYQQYPELRGENAVVEVRQGWNEVLLKYVRCGTELEAAFLWSEMEMPKMTPDISNTAFPWEE